MANALFSHVVILSTMFSFEDSVKCIVKHCPAVKNFLRYAIKVCSLVYRRNHHDPHPVVQQDPPLFYRLPSRVFRGRWACKKWPSLILTTSSHRISSSPPRIGRALCAIWLEEPCLPPFMGARRKGLIFIVPPDNYLRNELVWGKNK